MELDTLDKTFHSLLENVLYYRLKIMRKEYLLLAFLRVMTIVVNLHEKSLQHQFACFLEWQDTQ